MEKQKMIVLKLAPKVKEALKLESVRRDMTIVGMLRTIIKDLCLGHISLVDGHVTLTSLSPRYNQLRTLILAEAGVSASGVTQKVEPVQVTESMKLVTQATKNEQRAISKHEYTQYEMIEIINEDNSAMDYSEYKELCDEFCKKYTVVDNERGVEDPEWVCGGRDAGVE